MTSKFPRWWFCVALLVTLVLNRSVPAYSQETDQEEAQAAAITAKFVTVLEKGPKRGTALDKVYGHHVERGSLDSVIKAYRDKAAVGKGAEAAPSWMIIGLLESLRGQDAVSVDAFGKAESLDPTSYLASYYLGQALVLVGQPDKAAEALERSISRKPSPADQLEIYQSLGRVYQRAQKNDKALEVWNRLEKQYPNDLRVQEQIATTLLEENEFAAALPRFENLAKSTKDKYRQSQFQMEVAEIKVRLGKSAEAIQEFEKLLSQLNPDNWLFREVRRRIENVYLRTDDQAGLVAYYEAWVKKRPEDLEATSRLARLLAGLGRGQEAQAWLEKGLKVAPSRKELRNALISQLLFEQKFAEAIAQYEQLDKFEPNNPDTLRDWGRLILKDTKRDEATRKKDAGAVWRRLTTARPKDPLVASQVAELFRHAEMVEDALSLYQKAIELAPDAAQYKEYLGEYFHVLQRKDEAMAIWRQIAEGKARSAANLARLAEVLSGFGYISEAVESNAEACKLDPKEINLQIKQADLLAQAEKHEDALAQLAIVHKLASSDEEREAWLQRQLKELQALEKLKERISTVQTELMALPAASSEKEKLAQSDQWFWLARAQEAERLPKEAAESIRKAGELAPQSIPVLMSSARILESQQNLMAAVEANTRLAAIDRRYRTEYLKKVAQLEVQLGRREKAIQAGRDVLAAAPGNPELYEFFSQLCFQLGENEEGLQALRRSVRVNPSEPRGLLMLASALAEQFRTSESIELYWRAFEKAANLEDRLGVIPKLTELYLQTNQFDRLLERLENLRREPNQQREMTICLAQAYQSAGDDGNARQELEKLLTEDTRDTQLLQQLVKLCEQDGDLEAAIRFQQQLSKVSPGRESTVRLAQLLMKSGETEEASRLLTESVADEKDPEQLLKSIDSLLAQKNFEQVLAITERPVRDQPRNWELLYRNGVALAARHPEEAARRFEAILALNFKDDEQTQAAKKAQQKNQGRSRAPAAQFREMHPIMLRSQYSYQIRQAVGMDRNAYGNPQPMQQFWTPHDYGAARMACLAWLNSFAVSAGKEDDFVKQHLTAAESSADERLMVDAYYLASTRQDSAEQYKILKKLSHLPGVDAGIKSLYLTSLRGRGGPQSVTVVNEETGENEIKLEPLDEDELKHVLACYKDVDEETAMFNYGQAMIEIVAAELKRAGRADEAQKMLTDAVENATSPLQIAAALSGAVQRQDFETTMKLLERLTKLSPDNSTPTAPGVFNYRNYITSPQYQSQLLGQLMGQRAQKKEFKDVIALWDRFAPLIIKRYQEEKKQTASAKKRNANAYQYGSPGYYYIWRGTSQRGEQIDFPTPNDVYDQTSLQTLRQAFAVFKDADQMKDLIDHFQRHAKDDKLSADALLVWRLGLGYLYWWDDEKDNAVATLTEVAASLPNDGEMTFELARLHEKRGDPEQALSMIEALPAADQQTMQKREIAALRMSVNTGDIDRARIAAERLFGLRLDSNLQIQLARQMHQLGMHEQAEAVLARAGRQAGNKTDVLMNLMQQYQSQGKNDVAVQIAHQLLRRSNSNGAQYAMSGRVVRSGRDDGARSQALQVMKRSGKLPEMIKKVEDQLAHSPKSQKLLETLIEYYTAEGNQKKLQELTTRYSETKGDDPQFRFQLAMQLVQSGKHKESLEHFKVALKKDPRLLRNSYWEIQNAFENADKLDELANLYEEIDLKTFVQTPYELSNLIGNMSRRDKTKDRAIVLFKKAWKELPAQRPELLSNMNNDAFWKMPEIYDYARQGIIPSDATQLRQGNRWAGFGQVQSWDGSGKMTTVLSRLLAIAAQNKKLDELADEVQQSREKLKNWPAGEPLQALIDLRRGRIEAAKEVFEKLLPTMKGVQQVGYYTHWEIAQELMAHESCAELAIKYLEAAIKEPDLMTNNEFTYTPGKSLVTLYKQRGRMEDARRVLYQAMTIRSHQGFGNQQYEVYRRLRNAIALGKEFRALGYPIDAIRFYQENLSKTDDMVTAQRYGGDNIKNELQTGLQAALKELKPEMLPQLLTGAAGQNESVDLLLLLDSRELDKTRITSAIGKLVTDLSAKPEMLTKTQQVLEDARAQRPQDISALILSAQIALSANDSPQIHSVVNQLVELIQQNPLEEKPVKSVYTTAQIETARRQTAIWLIARDCLKKETLRSQGGILAERSLEASRRLPDNGFMMAILREWGQIALEYGDRQSAEQRWAEMLEIVLPKPVEKPRKKDQEAKTSQSRGSRREPALSGSVADGLSRWQLMLAPALVSQVAPAAAAASPIPAGRAATATGMKGNVVTLAQFEQAAQIARLASDNGFQELSLKAMSRSLHAGPPIEGMQASDPNTSGFPAVAQAQNQEQSQVVQKVEQQLSVLEGQWRKKGVPPREIYEFLKHTVLPDNRPLEVFLYPRPLSVNPNQPPQSVGMLLIQAAISAQATDDLRQAVEPRARQPLGELSGRVLVAQLALATKDLAAAKDQIDVLSNRLKLDSLQYTNELACHVAIPAMSLPELPPSGATLLERAVTHFAQNAQQGRSSAQEEPMRSFRFALARFHFQQGNPAAGKKHLEEYLAYLTPLYRNYSGDYGQYRRRQEMLKIAAEYARAGLQHDSFENLAQFADLPVSRNYGQELPGRAASMIMTGLAQLPAGEQYELLKKWSLPTSERKSVRVFAALAPADRAPASFDALRGATPRGPRSTHLQSTADLLVGAAQRASKLEELTAELQPHADQNVENARFLLLMTRIAKGEGAAVNSTLNEYLEDRRKNLPNQGNYQNRPQLLDAVLARSAMRDPHLKETGRQLGINFFLHGTRTQEHLLMAMMRHDYNASLLGDDISNRLDTTPSAPGLQHWTAGSTVAARNEVAGAMPMWWLAHDGLVTHICGPDQSHLYLKYPLGGSFEISCESWLGGWSESDIGYGGLVYMGLNGGNDTTVFPVGNRGDLIHKADPPEQSDHYNRLTLKVEPDGIRYFVNGHLIHTERNSASTAPWFFLHCDRVWQTVFRNIQIKGEPVVLSEVQLSQKESLLGWVSDFYGETQPPRAAAITSERQVADYDWSAFDGMIFGRMQAATGFGKPMVQQSRLYYDRPLLDGDRLKYEFWHESGAGGSMVHPAFDRLALLLESDGVKVHWMTDGIGPEDAYAGLMPDNVIEDKSIRRGRIELKESDWNLMEISLKGDIVILALNGTVICERPLEKENSRQFGFYHDKNSTEVKVRKVVLTGDWPTKLSPEILGNLLAPTQERSPAERRLVGAIIEEKFQATDLDHVLLRTRQMPPPQRYEALKAWVLPNDDHQALRVYADTAPADVPAIVPNHLQPVHLRPDISAGAGQNSLPAVRQRTGGELIAPVLDLVAVARELGKLDELAKEVGKVADSTDQIKRSRASLQVLIAIASNDDQKAAEGLDALTVERGKGLSDALPQFERWPELLAAWEASRIPALRTKAIGLLDLVVDSANRKGIGVSWDVKVRSVRQRALLLRDKGGAIPTASSVSPKGQWAQSTIARTYTRSFGMVPSWRFDGTDSLHLGGEGNDFLYFQSPLRGTFTIEGELATFGWREAYLMYAAQYAGPQYTLEAANIGNLYTDWVGPKFATKLAPMGDWCQVKLKVTPEKVEYYVNDRLIHDQALTAGHDPWIAIRSTGQYAAATKSLRILGEPEIPTELRLSERADLQGWWADLYQDPLNGENPAWKKEGNEIIGARLAQWEGRSRESVLQYHRPMLEDGEISYDFFYAPEQTVVHPTLGRMVLMLADDGVKIHWLTDAQFERSGLSPDNLTIEKEFRRGPVPLPLKANDWNKIDLRLKGDLISLLLNDQLVYERPVDPTNLRTFGLFHYSGDTESRVRNVVYKGQWPRTLPDPKAQELSGNDLELASFKPEELPARFDWNFQGKNPALVTTGNFPTTKRTSVADGLQIVREPNSEITSDGAGFQWPGIVIGGDFEVTLSYRDFKSSTQQTNQHVPRVEIILALEGVLGQHAQTLAITHRRMHDNNMIMSAIQGIRRSPPAEEWQSSDQFHVATGGKIRIARRNGTAYYLFAKPDSDQWTLVDRRSVSTGPVRDLLIGLRSEDLAANSSVVLTDFALRAKSLDYIPRFSEGDLPGSMIWNGVGATPKGVQSWASEAPNKFERLPDGTRIHRPADPQQKGSPAGFNWQGTLRGDFEVTLSYRDFESTTDVTDWRIPRVEIHIPIGGPNDSPTNSHTATMGHRRGQTGTLAIGSGVGERQPDGQKAWKTNELPTDRNSGRMRVIRLGSMIYSLAAPLGSDNFSLISTRPASSEEIKSISFSIRSESKNSAATVTFTEMTIRAKELQSGATLSKPLEKPAPFGANDLPAKVSWNFQGTRPVLLGDWGSRMKTAASSVTGGTRITRAANVPANEGAVGYVLNGSLIGDFEVTLDFRDFESVSVATDWRVPRVDISASISTKTTPEQSAQSAGIALRRNHGGDLKILATQGDKQSDGQVTYKTIESPTDVAGGRLRLVRQGTAMFYQSALPASENWITVNKLTVDSGPVRYLSLGIRSEDLESSGSAVLTNVSIRAKEILKK